MKKLRKVEGSCALIALWYVSGVDEETVLRVCTSCGFEAGQGMEDEDILEAANCLSVKTRSVPVEQPCTLYQFIKRHPKGLYLVVTVDHMFVVDNSVIFDPRHPTPPGLTRRIKGAWKVMK